jgi:BsuBI/PstI restriction endonuclease domain
LKIEADKNLPDIILADLGPTEPLIVFVEVVATDGAITPRRQQAIHALTDAAGFRRSQIAFLTAYRDRESAGFKKTVGQLAWDSFAWFVSEPGNIIAMHDGGISPARLSDLIGRISPPHGPGGDAQASAATSPAPSPPPSPRRRGR